jgi:CBS domain-containing protein
MRIQDILRRKGAAVISVLPEITMLEAMQVLVQHNIGAVVVVSKGEILGILTERDVLRLGAEAPAELEVRRVADVMTTDLVVGVPGDAIEYVAAIMTENRIRHLPVVEGEELVGILSIGDVVNAIRTETEVENRYLRSYIDGAYR